MSPLTLLKEKKVVQWMLGYLAGAFVVIQVMDGLQGALDLSQKAQQGVVVLLATGLAMTPIVAWYHGEKGHQTIPMREVAWLSLVALGGLAAMALLWITPAPPAASVPDQDIVTPVTEGRPQSVIQDTSVADSGTEPVSEQAASGALETPPQRPSPPGTVIPAARLNTDHATIAIGDSIRLFADSDLSVRWESSNRTVAVVSSEGLVVGLEVGVAEILGTMNDQVLSALVTVQRSPVVSLTILPLSNLATGDTVMPRVIVDRANGREDGSATPSWTSSDATVLLPLADGRFSVRGAGSVELTATLEGVVQSLSVVVDAAPESTEAAERLPDPVVLEAALEAYRVALEAGDIGAVQTAYPGITEDQRSGWITLFEIGPVTAAFINTEILRVDAESATLEFDQVLNGQRIQQNTTRFIAEAQRVRDVWVIRSLQSR